MYKNVCSVHRSITYLGLNMGTLKSPLVVLFFLSLISLLPLAAFTASAAACDHSSSSSTDPLQGEVAGFYVLKKGNFSLKVTNWGATITSLLLPDSQGKIADVVLGYDHLNRYTENPQSFGVIAGRVANRIAGARFVLNGREYQLNKNSGNNTLHGGHWGFSRAIWTVKKKVDGASPYITLYYRSADGEEGFPGALDVYVTYKISGPYKLSISMRAKALNKATPVNLIQHTYWNLGGHNSGTILSNTVQIYASQITPVNDQMIPTGEFASVAGTPYDFRTPRTVGSRFDIVKSGYDINYVVDGRKGSMRKVAAVKDGRSGRAFELWADQQGVQFYTGNRVGGEIGKGGYTYSNYDGLCLETQAFPDAVHHPNFPSIIVNPGQTYRHNMVFKFSF